MGLRGPPKKPTELKMLQGIPGGKHKLTPDEPKPKRLRGSKPPEFLDQESRKVWRKFAPRLEALGLLTELDTQAFGRYCELYARWLKAGQVLKSNAGKTHVPIFHPHSEEELQQMKANPNLKIPPRLKYIQELPEAMEYRHLLGELLRLEMHFGMTPSSRSSISVVGSAGSGGPHPKDPVKNFLYGT